MKIYKKPLSECPKCGDFNLEEVDTSFYSIFMKQHVVCVTCKHEWEEIWNLKKINEEELNEQHNN